MKSRCCAAWPQWRYRAALYFVLVWRWRRNRNSFVVWFQRVLSFNRSSTLFRIDEAFILRSSPNNYSFLDWRLTRAKKFLEWNIFLAWGGMKWPVQVQHHLLWSMLGGCTWFVTGLFGKAEPRLASSPAVSLRVASSLARPWLWPRAAMLPRPSAVWTGRQRGLIPTATDPLTAMVPCFELFFWTGNEKGFNFAGSKKDLPCKIMGNHGNGMWQNWCISYVYIVYSGILYETYVCI